MYLMTLFFFWRLKQRNNLILQYSVFSLICSLHTKDQYFLSFLFTSRRCFSPFTMWGWVCISAFFTFLNYSLMHTACFHVWYNIFVILWSLKDSRYCLTIFFLEVTINFVNCFVILNYPASLYMPNSNLSPKFPHSQVS